MDPDQPIIQTTPTPEESPTKTSTQGSSVSSTLSQKSGEFIHNNYETFLRRIFGFIFTILNFIRSTIMQIIAQIFSK